MKLRLLDVAVEDLMEGAHYYDAKEAGLGDYFLASLYSDIEKLATFGGIHPLAYPHIHRALSARFPFAIYYSIQGDEVLVRAIIGCRRSPAWIRRHIQP